MHRAEREAPTPEALMRSRYAAYSLGLGEYLVNTLSEAHPDRAVPREQLARSLSQARQTLRFLDLLVLHASTAADRGEVLFRARVFERGTDRSFAELSFFLREGSAWRYASGVLVPAERLPGDIHSLDGPAFLALAESLSRERSRTSRSD
jgi:SEC-C motif-containing protein